MKKLAFFAHTQVGFEFIVAEQLQQEFEGLTVHTTRTISDKNGMVVFSYDGDIDDLLAVRTIEDLFVQVLYRDDIPPIYAGLKQLTDVVSKMRFDDALTLARTMQPGRGGKGKLRFRMVTRQANQASYKRIEAQDALAKGLRAREDHKWQYSEENALEFWMTLLPDEVFIGLRLSDEGMRRNDLKKEQIAASLRPSAAAALVWLTRPRPTDVFLDPMCGAGTLLIERGEAGRYKQLLGGDIRDEAVNATKINIGSRYKPIEVQVWDARNLPLDAASISNVAVNLPFGKQIGTTEENRGLYPAFLREMERVVRPAGRLALLTGDVRSFESALNRSQELTTLATFNVQVLGQRARAYQLERK